MNNLKSTFAVILLLAVAQGAAADGVDLPTVPGTIGMTPVAEGACLAVYVPMDEGTALTGILWYNNDGSVVFPEVLVASGIAGAPEPVADALPVASDVAGTSSAWSELNFSEPVAAANEGFYVVFRLPAGSDHASDGVGGGAGIGYTEGPNGYTGWLSPDGEEWVKLQASFGMAVSPLVIDADDGMAVKSAEPEGEVPVSHTALLLPSPNPFNPSTELHYQLKAAGDVDLSIYNVRGERVVRLATGHHAAGRYRVQWHGSSTDGQRVASGTYIARFIAGPVVQTQRLTLVK